MIDPVSVSIGNGTQLPNGTYLNAQKLADNLVFTSITVFAGSNIDIVEPVDVSSSSFGTPHFNLALSAPTINIDYGVKLAAAGNLNLTTNILNLNGRITSGGEPIAANRVTGTATQANVLSSGASIQQAIDFSSPTNPLVVQVGSGEFTENLTISKPLRLTGNDGTGPLGADPTAPLLLGIQSGGSLIKVTANEVKIDGMRLHGGGTTPSAVNGLYAKGVNSLTVAHNTFEGFSGPAIETPESTNVALEANELVPTLLSTAVTPASATVAVDSDTPMTDTGTYSEGPTGNVTGEAVWTSSEPAVVSVDAAGLAHAIGLGTSTITATVGSLKSSATIHVVGPPAASVDSPPDGQSFETGQLVTTSFSCTDASGAPGIQSCVDSNGASGGSGTLDTGAPGSHSYAVTATSLDEQTGSATINYTVGEAGQCRELTKYTTPKLKHGQYVDAGCETFYTKKGIPKAKGNYEWYPGSAADCIAFKQGEYTDANCTAKSAKAHKGTYERQPCFPDCSSETEYRTPPVLPGSALVNRLSRRH